MATGVGSRSKFFHWLWEPPPREVEQTLEGTNLELAVDPFFRRIADWAIWLAPYGAEGSATPLGSGGGRARSWGLRPQATFFDPSGVDSW